jgi:hypothetical protein
VATTRHAKTRRVLPRSGRTQPAPLQLPRPRLKPLARNRALKPRCDRGPRHAAPRPLTPLPCAPGAHAVLGRRGPRPWRPRRGQLAAACATRSTHSGQCGSPCSRRGSQPGARLWHSQPGASARGATRDWRAHASARCARSQGAAGAPTQLTDCAPSQAQLAWWSAAQPRRGCLRSHAVCPRRDCLRDPVQHVSARQLAWLAYVAAPAQPLRGPRAGPTVVKLGDAPPSTSSRPKPVCVEPVSRRGENAVYPSSSTHARSPLSPSWGVRATRHSRVFLRVTTGCSRVIVVLFVSFARVASVVSRLSRALPRIVHERGPHALLNCSTCVACSILCVSCVPSA